MPWQGRLLCEVGKLRLFLIASNPMRNHGLQLVELLVTLGKQ